MKNLFKIIGIIALVAIIVFSMATCGDIFGNDDDNGNADSSLNGTWVYSDNSTSTYTYEITFNNGNWETFEYEECFKGTYTTSGNKLTMTPTHFLWNGPPEEGIESNRWYSKAELV
jgi:hypothetical protein